ncbi:MAG: hypothetical protein ACHQ9S_16060 [Candidatus Binatia bacterium]
MITFITATVSGAFGWWLGSYVGFMTAYVLSVVGTAAGVYLGRRWTTHYMK